MGEDGLPARGVSGARRSAAWASPALDVLFRQAQLCHSASTLPRCRAEARIPTRSSATGANLGWWPSLTAWAARAAPSTRLRTGHVPVPISLPASLRDIVEERMLALLDPEVEPGWADSGAQLEAERQARTRRYADGAERAGERGLRSRLLRALPTTMALMALQRREPREGHWAGHVFWSGDSRVYVFDPATGAHQLSRDDLRDQGDALANLRQDSVVSNAMSADVDFVVHHHQVELAAPFLAVAATDGCFGYLRTPDSLRAPRPRFAAGLHRSRVLVTAPAAGIAVITGDDAAMAVLGVGADHRGVPSVVRRTDGGDRAALRRPARRTRVRGGPRRAGGRRGAPPPGRTADFAVGAYKPEYERYLGREEDG